MKRSFLLVLLSIFAMLSVAQTTGMKPYTVSIQELEPNEVIDQKQKAANPQRKFKPSKRGKESSLSIAYKDVFSRFPEAIAIYKIAPSFSPACYLVIESDKLIFEKHEWEAVKYDEADERREKKNKRSKIKVTKRTATVDEEFLKFAPKECSDYDLYEAILKKMHNSQNNNYQYQLL